MTLQVDIPTLETERLILRAPQIGDGDLFAEFVKTERSRFVGGPNDDKRASSRAWGHLTGLWVLRGYSSLVWCLKDGTVIGHGGPWYPATWPEPEFGWCIWSDEFEGQGYATEAITALHDWTFDTLGLNTCVAYINPENTPSIRLAERIGGKIDRSACQPFDDEVVCIYRFEPGAA